MQHVYHTIEEMIAMIDEPNRSACANIMKDNRALFQQVQGSTNNHQNWPGGYHDHVQEAMNLAVAQYALFTARRPLPFSLSDALLVVFLHDIEKPWKYEVGDDGELHHIAAIATKAQAQEFRMRKLAEYGIALAPEQENGLKYVEGELGDYSNRRRVMGPLAAFCHICDVASARIWHDHPLAGADPWKGAARLRENPEK